MKEKGNMDEKKEKGFWCNCRAIWVRGGDTSPLLLSLWANCGRARLPYTMLPLKGTKRQQSGQVVKKN